MQKQVHTLINIILAITLAWLALLNVFDTTELQLSYPMYIYSSEKTDTDWAYQPLGNSQHDKPPVICNVQLVQGLIPAKTVAIIADTQRHAIILGQLKNDKWVEDVICSELKAPARANPCDFDNDGDIDFLIAELGDVFPNDNLVGSVMLLENSNGIFELSTLISGLGRVADVQAGDFNNDGFLDLAIAEFGHGHGRVLQCIQLENGSFRVNPLLPGPGSIHVPVADYNNDGLLDIACVLSQEEEEVWVCYNDGKGNMENVCIFKSMNPDFGSSGLIAEDLDNDGDVDLLLPHGDNLEEFFHYPQTHHGCLLLENTGDKAFTRKKISSLPGCYAASCGDLDNDGDKDLVLLSMVNDWRSETACSVQILKNDGQLNFSSWQLASRPTSLITCAVGDIDGNGKNDIIAGSFQVQPPYNNKQPLHAWISK